MKSKIDTKDPPLSPHSEPSGISEDVQIRGLRYHVRRWGKPGAPRLIMVHGWMDVSDTFSIVAEHLGAHFEVLIPDWRGFGDTQWSQGSYWFAEYVGDLDALADHYAPQGPILLAGHSMGAQAASLFAGLRPDRVSRLAILDGLFLPDGNVTNITGAYRKWLDNIKREARVPTYGSFEELAKRVKAHHPNISDERAAFVARCWGRSDADGRVRLRSDPTHLFNMPRTYLQAESDQIWSQITAPTLFVDGGASALRKALPAEETRRRRALFRDHAVAEMPGVGHMLHFEAPEALASLLIEHFLERSQG